MKTAALTAAPGTYVLILRCPRTTNIRIGSWGRLCVQPGYYLYVGSAFGPGGLRARVSRHCRRHKNKRWHIDYLRQFTAMADIWYSREPEHLEHRWAESLGRMAGMQKIPRFGCSDCQCPSHLFYAMTPPQLADFAKEAGDTIERL